LEAIVNIENNSEPSPQFIWDTINAYQRTAALRAAVELDLFTLIADGVDAATDIATRSGASARGIRILCDYLSVIGFLRKFDNRYQLTTTSSVFLNRKSPACMASMVEFLNSPKLMAGFANFTETVRRGTTQLDTGGVNEPECSDWVTFAENMTPLMAGACELVAEECARMTGPRMKVLDVAAGHGLFGISVARRIGEAQITAQDWPNVLKIAQRNANSAGVGDRYHLLPGDIFKVDLDGEYDVILVANLLHHFDQPTCIRLLEKLHQSMAEEGRLIILEFVPDEDRVTPPIPASFALMLLGVTPAGDVYSARQLHEFLSAAQFNKPVVVPVPQSPQCLVISEKRTEQSRNRLVTQNTTKDNAFV
jgi:ubiquinone/menaquinone biosynthesis C-methylase UbiE